MWGNSYGVEEQEERKTEAEIEAQFEREGTRRDCLGATSTSLKCEKMQMIKIQCYMKCCTKKLTKNNSLLQNIEDR